MWVWGFVWIVIIRVWSVRGDKVRPALTAMGWILGHLTMGFVSVLWITWRLVWGCVRGGAKVEHRGMMGASNVWRFVGMGWWLGWSVMMGIWWMGMGAPVLVLWNRIIPVLMEVRHHPQYVPITNRFN